MASPGDRGAANSKHLRVLLPFTCDTLLAAEIGAEEALVVGPAGGKVKFWPVEVGQDGDGAFLGRGWPEFAEACGAAARWLLVLRHRGRGVLSVKAFDATCCLRDRELGAPASPAGTEVEATTSSKDSTRKPQFIRVLPKDFMEKMLIPAKFVEQHIPKEFLDKETAIVLGPIAKVFSVKLEMGESGMFFAGGWSQFLKFHHITEANALLLRYEGNMVFTLKVYEPNGYQRESKHKENRDRQISTLPDTEEQQEVPSASMQKQQEALLISIQKQHENDFPSSNGEKEPQGSTTSLDQASFKIGPPSWIEKQINANTLKNHINLPKAFCDAIGLGESCKITLKTSRNGSEYWQVHGLPCKNSNYQLGKGWKGFCRDNSLREGDICTFSVIDSTIWHVIITRLSALSGTEELQEAPSVSIQKQYNNMIASIHAKKKPQGSTASLDKASFKRKSVYEIGPPAWIEKHINATTLKNCLDLPKAFCDGIGLQERCMISLKTSTDAKGSWQVHGCPCKDSKYLLGQGWNRFCLENGLKEGDICTFNVIESTMWHVLINRYVQEEHKTPFAFSRKRKGRNASLSSEDKKRKGSNTFLKNASSARGVYEIGPPTWIKKEISSRMIRQYISFPPTFCDAIGLREASTITFKTSLNSTGSWQVRVIPYENTSHQVGSGWKKFCRENEIKEGDVCTFNVVETMLWHVVVERC